MKKLAPLFSLAVMGLGLYIGNQLVLNSKNIENRAASSKPNYDAITIRVQDHYKQLLGWGNMPSNDSGLLWHYNYVLTSGCLADTKNFISSQPFTLKKKTLTNEQYADLLFKLLTQRYDAASTKYWANQLVSGKLNRDTLVDEMYKSPEVQQLCNAAVANAKNSYK